MKSGMRRHLSPPLIEPLESRIAPAGVFTFTNYTDPAKTDPKLGPIQFIHASDPTLTGGNLEIAQTVGLNPDIWFIKVQAGQDVQVPTSGSPQDVVNVTSGTVIAFFDSSLPGPTIDGQLSGLALGNKVSVAIGVPVNKSSTTGLGGDIVTNFNDADSLHPLSGNTLLPNLITSLSVAGDVGGTIAAGGNISRLFVSGKVGQQILTGTAANGYTFDFSTVSPDPAPAGADTLTFATPAAKIAGPSISNAIIGSTPLIHLGNGGAGAAGGGINGLQLLSDLNGITVTAGNGGAGAIGRTTGGAGGAITNVDLVGPNLTSTGATSDSTPNSQLTFTGGVGGAGLGTARGGAGGAVTSIFIGYDSAHTSDPSNGSIADNVTLQGGAGGTGGTGGAGGALSNDNIITYTPHVSGGITPELQLLAGAGGSSAVGGKGGVGGAITNSQVLDKALPQPLSALTLPVDTGATSPTSVQMLVQSGAGGSVAVKGAGGAGGAVSGLTLKGFNFTIDSGLGGNGISSGGNGGAINAVNVLGSPGNLPGDDFHAESLTIATGAGGAGSAGRGGAGGAVTVLNVQNADINTTGLNISTGAGGSAGKGAGGAGGAISNAKVTDLDFLTTSHPLGNDGNVVITTGNGGVAPGIGARGGAGGAMTNVQVIGTRLSAPNISTGSGGAGGANAIAGRGGAGGAMTDVAIRSAEGFFASTITAGTGILIDPVANFSTLKVGDQVINVNTSATTTITALTSTHQVALASDIFATGDAYTAIDTGGNVSGTAADSQNILNDSSANFSSVGLNPENVQVGDVVEDNNVFVNTFGVGTAAPTFATVTAVTANQLTLSADIARVGDQYDILTKSIVNISTGSGGAGNLTGAGGAGGAIVGSNAVVPGSVTVTAGNGGGVNGGAGAAGAPGAGGSLNGDAALSSSGSASLLAGSAGTTGGKAAKGGAIAGANLQALTNISAIAGNGAFGGAGGSITGGGFSGPLISGGGFNPPQGKITVTAGNGGTSPTKTGGAGGSVSVLTGFVSSGAAIGGPFTTAFTAGQGGNGVTKGGAGGSLSSLRFFGGGGAGVTFTMDAGDAGNASAGKTGATGGSITNIGGGVEASSTTNNVDFTISPLTVFHHISAGNGGNATTKGGLGGSVSNVLVNAAVGVRFGAAFGFASDLGAGGISAGSGGTGTTPGLAGNVTNISADAIASIVAGHNLAVGSALLATNLATKVDGIILNGTVAPSTVEQFELTFKGQTTGPIATNAAPVTVAQALNNLSTITTAGGVTVSPTSNGYQIAFNIPANNAPITGTELPASPFTLTAGTGTETIVYPLPISSSFTTAQLATANFVGSVLNPTQNKATTFTYTPAGPFVFGDVPIDGLIAAVTLTANKNFVPEAFVTEDASGHAVLIDNTNS
jgi:hypothetical protein